MRLFALTIGRQTYGEPIIGRLCVIPSGALMLMVKDSGGQRCCHRVTKQHAQRTLRTPACDILRTPACDVHQRVTPQRASSIQQRMSFVPLELARLRWSKSDFNDHWSLSWVSRRLRTMCVCVSRLSIPTASRELAPPSAKLPVLRHQDQLFQQAWASVSEKAGFTASKLKQSTSLT